MSFGRAPLRSTFRFSSNIKKTQAAGIKAELLR
jgi:hypothetical protein